MKSELKQSPKTQKDKFEQAARELDTDDSEEAFDAKLKKIAKAPPAEKSPKTKRD
jgi:hypothetical protein